MTIRGRTAPKIRRESRSDGRRLCSCLTASIEELRRASQRSSLRDYPWGGVLPTWDCHPRLSTVVASQLAMLLRAPNSSSAVLSRNALNREAMAVDSLGWQSEIGPPPRYVRSRGATAVVCARALQRPSRHCVAQAKGRRFATIRGVGCSRPGIAIPGYRRSLLRNWRFSCEPPIVARLSSAATR